MKTKKVPPPDNMPTALLDYDLDIGNLLKDFPEDDINDYMYFRTWRNPKTKEAYTMLQSKGTVENLVGTLHSFFYDQDENKTTMANVIMSAVINFLKEDREEKQRFIEFLNNVS